MDIGKSKSGLPLDDDVGKNMRLVHVGVCPSVLIHEVEPLVDIREGCVWWRLHVRYAKISEIGYARNGFVQDDLKLKK